MRERVLPDNAEILLECADARRGTRMLRALQKALLTVPEHAAHAFITARPAVSVRACNWTRGAKYLSPSRSVSFDEQRVDQCDDDELVALALRPIAGAHLHASGQPHCTEAEIDGILKHWGL